MKSIIKERFLSDIRKSQITSVINCQRNLAHQDSLGELLHEIDEQLSNGELGNIEDESPLQQDQNFRCFGEKVLVESYASKTTQTNSPKLNEITQIFEKSQSLNTTPNKRPLLYASQSYEHVNFSLTRSSESVKSEFPLIQGQLFKEFEYDMPKRNKRCDTSFFEIWPDNILYDVRTTIMIKNIPNKYTLNQLLDEINENFSGQFDFFYLPVDYSNGCNVGYAFINFLDQKDIIKFYEQYNGRRWRKFNSEKICELRYARIQGKNALVNHFSFPPQLNKLQQIVENQKNKD